MRKVRAYTEIGKRISALGKRQRAIAKVLGVSQQTISKKLRGETEILLSDFQTMARHYRVPITYFFEEAVTDPDLAKALEKVKRSSGALQELVVLLSRMPKSSVEKVLALTKVIGQGKRAGTSKSDRAAEASARYSKSE